jgi:N-methylhydantoinase A
VKAFEAEHLKTFGYISPGDALQFVAVKAICSGVPATPRMPDRVQRGNERAVTSAQRNAFYGEEHGMADDAGHRARAAWKHDPAWSAHHRRIRHGR